MSDLQTAKLEMPQQSASRPQPSTLSKLQWVIRVLQVRLRLLMLAAVAFLIVGKWDVVRGVWDKLTAPDPHLRSQSVAAGIEYFCPMDPGVVSEWPAKCPVCNMALVQRKIGDMPTLPEGVVARMQFSPYRVQIAGVRTSEVVYAPLAYSIACRGTLTEYLDSQQESPSLVTDTIDQESALSLEAEVSQSEVALLRGGQTVEIFNPGDAGAAAHSGHVERILEPSPRRVSKVRIAVDGPAGDLRPGMFVAARIRVPVADIEPFRSLPSDPPALRTGESRSLFVCPDHADVTSLVAGKCPLDQQDLMLRDLLELERVGWWCPMHADVTADHEGEECDRCQGMKLVPQIVNFRPRGAVLAVPETAVVDLGSRKFVYVERSAGTYDAVAVEIGARSGDSYPVAKGLSLGQRVVSAGAFLVDAEARLNPSMSAMYFGASAGSASKGVRPAQSTTGSADHDHDQESKIAAALSKLSSADQAAAKRQRFCPVTDLRLGSMGLPVQAKVRGEAVFLCCVGCSAMLQAQPEKYLAKLRTAAQPDSKP